MIRITVDLPEELHRQIKIYCATNGLRLADVIRKLISDLMGKEAKKKK
jgi:Arc/MetJ-type ribon-helix-helix transcriptional regulator